MIFICCIGRLVIIGEVDKNLDIDKVVGINLRACRFEIISVLVGPEFCF